MRDLVWIDWRTSCRRSRELCNYLQIEPYVLNSALSGKSGLVELTLRTIRILFKTTPCVLTVASLRIAIIALLLKPFLRFFLIVDCHYAGIIPRSGIPRFFHNLYSYIHCRADLVLVTNKPHAEIVKLAGGRPLILQDRIPTPVFSDSPPDASGKKKVVCICSYNEDEPIDQIIHAAQLLIKDDITLFLTGDSRGKFAAHELPENVVLTGYLTDEKYWQLLFESDLVVDLTTRENCLLCGAYEAVAVGKPMVLSNFEALRSYFTSGVVYTENSGCEIAFNIRRALDSAANLNLQVQELRGELEISWEPAGEALKGILKSLCNPRGNIYHQERTGVFNG